MNDLDTARLTRFEQDLRALIERFGAEPGDALTSRVHEAVAQLRVAVRESVAAGRANRESLSALDVVRIRAGKLAARSLPPTLYRDAARLAALRAEILLLAAALVGTEGASGSRFG